MVTRLISVQTSSITCQCNSRTSTRSGASVTLGSSKLTNTNDSQQVINVASTVGSIEGNVNINSGKTYNQTGSDVLTPQGDVNITAEQVNITAATDSYNSQQTMKYKQSGLTLAITSPVISAIQTVQQMSEASKQTDDPRMQALAAGTAALAVKNAADAVISGNTPQLGEDGLPTIDANGQTTDQNPANQVGGINISISIGSSKSSSSSSQTSTSAASSHVTAGGDINITATGAGKDSDINVIGSTIKAADNVTLKADDQINLLAAQNVDTLKEKNSGSSASIGVSFGTNGFLVTASASGSKGKGAGNGTSWTETEIQSGDQEGDTVKLASGSDTTLRGAQVTGNQVIANVGINPTTGEIGQGNLNIQSLQDTNDYKSKQQSIGGSISVGAGTMGGSFNYSASNIKSNYTSVNEQSGIMAGDGGFQVNVAGNTNLTGAVIASTEQAIQDNKNSLTTETLTIANIENQAAYKADSMSMSAGVGTHTGDKGEIKSTPTASAGVASDSDKASSVTVTGISGATVNITDNHQQQVLTNQDAITVVATLNRDVHTEIIAVTDNQGNTSATYSAIDSQGNNLANTITPIFDKEKVARELQAAVTITQAFSQVAPKAVADFAAYQLNSLIHQAQEADIAEDGATATQLMLEAEKWDEGGIYRIALHTALGGLITGDLSGALGAGAIASAAPLLSNLQANVKKSLESAGLGQASATVVSQALAELTSVGIGSAIGGTSAAGTALVVDTNNRQLHWDGFLKEKTKCDKNPSSLGCGAIEKMAGVTSRVISSDISGLPNNMVIGNFDEQGNLVSYTVADLNGQPQFIMQPLEFEVYRNATPGIRATMNFAPQWALDYASALIYNSTGQTDTAIDHVGLMLTNPTMWTENAVGLLGGVLAGAEIRTANTIVEGALVNSDSAIIDTRKLIDYALNPTHPVGGNKAIVFESALGYNQSNATSLISQIERGITQYPAIAGRADQYGSRFSVDIPITGPNGNTVVVRSAWIYDPGSINPRLTSIYVK